MQGLGGGISVLDSSLAYTAPSSGFSLTIALATWHQIIDPSGTLATGTITMPLALHNGHMVVIISSQTITALTISTQGGQGSAAAPTTIIAGGRIEAIYRLSNNTWYFGV